MDYTRHRSTRGLGFIGNGGGQGLLQHSALATTGEGELLGVLHQTWWHRQRASVGETRRQRQARPTEACLWAKTIEAIEPMGKGTRLIHVMDRGADSFQTMDAARRMGVGFLLRAKHNRYLANSTQRLWSFLAGSRVCGHREVEIAARPAKGATRAIPARTARLAIRYARVVIPPPRNDPRFTVAKPLTVWAVCALETNPPPEAEPVEWMLLTSEVVNDFASCEQCLDGYTRRWLIEEWHKVETSGCRLEAAQLKDADALERLAALTAVVAVRLLQVGLEVPRGDRSRDPACRTSPFAPPPLRGF